MIYPWLVEHFATLRTMQTNNRLHHANVFIGPADFGIESLMQAFAQYLLCDNPSTEACGDCASCRLFLSGNHPDYHLLCPKPPSRLIKIDDWRALVPVLSQKAARGGCQIVCIEQADAMQASTANALLKTLEEPPGHLIFLLWAKNLQGLLPTVRSRTQHFFLQSNQTNAMQTWIKDSLAVDPNKPWLQSTYERPLAIASMQEQGYFEKRDSILEMMQAAKIGGLSAIKAAEKSADWDREMLLQIVLGIATDAVKSLLTYPEQSCVNVDKLPEISAIFKGMPLNKALGYYDVVASHCRDEQRPQALNRALQDCHLWLAFEEAIEEQRC